MSVHDEAAELLGAYALDAVDEDEVRAIEEHLAICPRCRSELANYREVAAMLGEAGGVAPEGIWERIAAELELDGAPVQPDGRVPTPADDLLGRAGAARLPQLAQIGGARGGGSATAQRRHTAIALAALGAVAAALAIVLGVVANRVDDLDHQLSAVQSAVTSRSLAALALEASLDPNDTEVDLRPAAPSPPAARLVVDRPTGTAYFVGTGLKALADDRTYQLWSLVRDKPVSIGLLGSRPLAVEVHVAPNMTVFMVTAEPEGGTPAPTGPIVVQGNLLRTS